MGEVIIAALTANSMSIPHQITALHEEGQRIQGRESLWLPHDWAIQRRTILTVEEV
jgi:hypothetical protein